MGMLAVRLFDVFELRFARMSWAKLLCRLQALVVNIVDRRSGVKLGKRDCKCCIPRVNDDCGFSSDLHRCLTASANNCATTREAEVELHVVNWWICYADGTQL
jgi:hypothetical protein